MPHPNIRRGQSILIVEDDAPTRKALVYILARLGYDVVPVATVAESLTQLDGQDRAILDLNLPDGLGTRVLSRIRSEGRPIRVAIVTGTDDDSLIADAQRMNAEVILRKPLDVSLLLEWLERDG